jgi:hypothetical protein
MLLLSFIYYFEIWIFFLGEFEDTIVDVSGLEIREADGCPEDADFYAQLLGVIVTRSEQGYNFLHLYLAPDLATRVTCRPSGALAIE